MKVIFSPASKADLEDVGDRIAMDNPGRAATFVSELRAACLSLADYPERSPVTVRASENLRRTVHGAYLIFYAVRMDHVWISRIVHSARLVGQDMFE